MADATGQAARLGMTLQRRGQPFTFCRRSRAHDDRQQDHTDSDSHDSGFCDDGYLLWPKH
jgi:hypothetical protein